jgi:probable HAF family extracellular repeat protein
MLYWSLIPRSGFVAVVLGLSVLSSQPLLARGKPPKDDAPTPDPKIGYTMTLLGTLGGEYSSAKGMNVHGDIVGYSETAPINGRNWQHGFLSVADPDGGRTMIDLNDLFLAEELIADFDFTTGTGWVVGVANDINDAGQIIGQIRIMENGALVDRFAFRYTPVIDQAPAYLDNLGTIYEGDDPGSVSANAINNLGQVAGGARIAAQGLYHAFVWTIESGFTDLGLMNGHQTIAADINDNGQVCGHHGYNQHAWRHSGQGFEDLGKLRKGKGGKSMAFSINEAGDVAGSSTIDVQGDHAFRYTDVGDMEDLGTLGGTYSYGGHLNNFRDVVGRAHTKSGAIHAFLFTDKTGMIDLDNLTVLEVEYSVVDLVETPYYGRFNPDGINDFGEIFGNTSNPHPSQAFVLTPSP